MKKINLILLLLSASFLFGCLFQKSQIKINLNNKKATIKSVTAVAVINNQIKVTGTGLSRVTSLRIHNSSFDETFSVESASATQVIGNASRAISFAVGQTFDLILSSAEGAATFPVSFTLSNGSVTASMLSDMGASVGETLIFNGTTWVHSPISASQIYLGTWSAATNSPTLSDATASSSGEYYIATSIGTIDFGSGNISFSEGDWVISDGSKWSKIANGSNYVLKSGSTVSGVLKLDSDLQIKSSSNGNYITIKSPALAADYDFTMPANPGTAGYVLSTNGSGVTSWVAASTGNVGTVTNVTSANTDIGVATGTSTPVLTLNSGTAANQIVKLNGSAQLPALNGSLLTSLNPASLSAVVPVTKGGTGLAVGASGGFPYFDSTTTMASTAAGTAGQLLVSGGAGSPTWITSLPIANGGTGATSLAGAQSALGITVGGATTGTAMIVGTGGVVANKICSADAAGGGVSCMNTASSALAGSITDESGTGALLFGTAPTISNPVITGQMGIGTATPGSALDVKGALRLSGSTSGYVGFAVPAAAGSTTYTLPAADGTNGQVLTTNASGVLSWTSAAGGGSGTVTSVTSANTDIGVATGTVTPVLTLNSGTAADQIVKLNGSAQLPAIDGSLLTSLNPANLSTVVPVTKGGTGLAVGVSGGIPYFNSTTTIASSALLGLNGVVIGGGAGASPTSTSAGAADQVLRIPGAGGAPAFGAIDLTKAAAVTGALPIANGGTGAATLGGAQSALGITIGGATTGAAMIVGTGGVVADKICSGDVSGGGVSCVNTTSSFLAGSITDESGTGALLFGTAPTIANPVIANIAPAANFTLTQNSVAAITSENAGAIVDTLYLKTGSVGIGTSTPQSKLDVNGSVRVGVDATACSAAIAGAMRFATPNVEYCNGTAWAPFSSSSTAVGSAQITDGTIVDADINASAAIAQSKIANLTTDLAAKEPTITAGTSAQYLKGDKSLGTFASDLLGTLLAGLSTATNAVIVAGDSVIGAFGKLQKQITDLDTAKLNKTGGTLSVGTISGVPTPTNPDDVANRGYVDLRLSLAGGSMTGAIQMNAQSETRYADADSSNYISLRAPAAVGANVVWTLPSTDGSSGQVLSTNGTGTLSWATAGGGSSWSAIQTAAFTATAGSKYLINTTSSAFTLTLPASATLGDTIAIVDAAGTFATNNLTVGANGLKIMGLSENMTVDTANVSFELVYADATFGWRIK